MPRSIFLGRPWPEPGEPLFTEEDTAWAVALAEEERDTCPACGYPKSVCRDPAYQFPAFEPHEEICGPTQRLAMYRETEPWTAKFESTKAATQLSARFREGYEAPIDAGLGLADERDNPGGSPDQA